MNNDPKIRRDNPDAGMRSLNGQVAALNIGAETKAFTVHNSHFNTGEVSAFESSMRKNGLIEKIEMTALPSSWGQEVQTSSIKEQMESFKAARDEVKPSWKDAIGKLFGQEKGKEQTGPSYS
jgi:hypothetical protein